MAMLRTFESVYQHNATITPSAANDFVRVECAQDHNKKNNNIIRTLQFFCSILPFEERKNFLSFPKLLSKLAIRFRYS